MDFFEILWTVLLLFGLYGAYTAGFKDGQRHRDG